MIRNSLIENNRHQVYHRLKLIIKNDKPDNFGTVVFVKGTNGEGARKGRNGFGFPLGAISGYISSIGFSFDRCCVG